MKKALLALVLAAMLAAPGSAGVLVDNFTDTGFYTPLETDVLLDYSVGADGIAPPQFLENDSRSPVAGALGGRRDVDLIVNGDGFEVGTTEAIIGAVADLAQLNSASGVDAEMVLSYGSLATAGGGLGMNADMSFEDRFIIVVLSVDLNAEVQIDIETDSTGAGNMYSYTELLPAASVGGFEIFFSNFVGFAATSNDVDGIMMTFRPQGNLTDLDITIGNIVATTPEPATMSLLAFGALGLLRRRRRKKR